VSRILAALGVQLTSRFDERFASRSNLPPHEKGPARR
jgi:hypothetical protein